MDEDAVGLFHPALAEATAIIRGPYHSSVLMTRRCGTILRYARLCAKPACSARESPADPRESDPPPPVSFHSQPELTRRLRATTILGVRRDGAVALAGDGQVTMGDVVLKHGARKIRTLYDGQVLAGFAGAVADALTLFAKFESQLKGWDGNLRRAAVELAKEWRTDRYLRRLEAQLLVGDPDSLLILSGEGDVTEPDDGIAAIGSGRSLCHRRRQSPASPHRARCARDRRSVDGHRRQHLHLHQRSLQH